MKSLPPLSVGCLAAAILLHGAVQAQVTPGAIRTTLEAGTAAEVVLTLANSGGEPLHWQARALQDAAGGALALAAGGDSFGYRWADSTEPGGPAFEWIDIAAIGQPLFLADDDAQLVALPFDFVFYGIRHDAVRIGSNGYLTFGPNGTAHTNRSIPSTASPNALIAVYWCDLDPTLGGSITTLADPAGGRFIVQYTDIQRFGGSVPVTFQAILHANGNITFNYPSATGIGALAANLTVGIENETGTIGCSVAHNTAFAPSGLAVRFYSPTWLSVAPLEGTLAPGATSIITARRPPPTARASTSSSRRPSRITWRSACAPVRRPRPMHSLPSATRWETRSSSSSATRPATGTRPTTRPGTPHSRAIRPAGTTSNAAT